METAGETILVTGGTGFIGSYIVDALLQQGIRTRIFAAHPPKCEDQPRAETVRGDIRDPEGVRSAMRGVRGVIHAAAAVSAWSSDPALFHDVNVTGTRNLLRAALGEGAGPFVHISSCSAITFSGGEVNDESAIIPRRTHLTEYGRSKALAEREVEQAAHRGLDTIIVYPTRVFGIGPLGDANAATKALSLYTRGAIKVLPGGGMAYANWGYVNDIAAGVLRALSHGRRGERYLLGGENIRLRDVLALAESILGARHRAMSIPLGSGRFLAIVEEWRASITRTSPRITRTWYDAVFEDTRLSCVKARDQLGYTVTPLREALTQVLLWLSDGAKGLPANPGLRNGTL
jgi:nucleoside-diphosphate-sugar epimerase